MKTGCRTSSIKYQDHLVGWDVPCISSTPKLHKLQQPSIRVENPSSLAVSPVDIRHLLVVSGRFIVLPLLHPTL